MLKILCWKKFDVKYFQWKRPMTILKVTLFGGFCRISKWGIIDMSIQLTSPIFYDLRTGLQIFELRLTESVQEKEDNNTPNFLILTIHILGR